MGSEPDASGRLELSLPATGAGFARGFEELRQGLDRMGLEPRARFAVELVFEEVVANVVRHGTRPGTETRIVVQATPEGDSVRLTFLDDGVPFDPRQRPDPRPASDLEHAPTGGRGLMLIRSVSRSLEYLRTPEGQNRLTVVVPADAANGARMSDGAPPGA